MNQIVLNEEGRRMMDRIAKRIHDGGVQWRQTPIQETGMSRATDPSRLAVTEWWKDLEAAAQIPDLPAPREAGVYKCKGSVCSKMNYGHDAATATEQVLRADKNRDARSWLADLSIDVDATAPANAAAWYLLSSHVRDSRPGSRVRDLNAALVRPALQILAANTWKAEDNAEREQRAIGELEKQESGEEPWQKYIHPEADSREWLDKLAARFDLNAPEATPHWARLRDHVLRSASGSKVSSLDKHLLKDTLRNLHQHRKGD